ncbi:MAG: RNA polymerase sigma-70 factor [Bacteroidia bacterium]|nr:RNA polymerase sigma-70 factor [Bacteroidia bacterium]
MPTFDQESADAIVFRKLFDQYYDAVRNFIYYRSGNMDLAEDLTQDAFMVLWNKRASIEPDKVKSYLFTIAYNLFLNEVKHQRVVLKHTLRPVSTVNAEDPQAEMEAEEFGKLLADAVGSLPEKQRTVFLMNRIDKMTYKEIADALRISIKAVEKRMHKALMELRKLSPHI